MIDELPNLFDTLSMLTTTDHAAKRDQTVTLPLAPKPTAEDLAFVSANQQLAGFPGKITEEIAAHRPNMEEIIESAKRFGAQIPTEENRQRKPLFKR